MYTATAANTGDSVRWQRAVSIRALGGLIAALVMALFATTAAATYQENGFMTPVYHIASAFGSNDAFGGDADVDGTRRRR